MKTPRLSTHTAHTAHTPRTKLFLDKLNADVTYMPPAKELTALFGCQAGQKNGNIEMWVEDWDGCI